MRPLPLFEVFARTMVFGGSDKKKEGLAARHEDAHPEAVTAAAFLGDPGDESLLIGTDAGSIYRFDIKGILAAAARRAPVADNPDGPKAKPDTRTPAKINEDKTTTLEQLWMTKPSRAASVELLMPLLSQGYRAIAMVGQDIRLRILDLDSGEILTTLSQGGGSFQVPLEPSVPLSALRKEVDAIDRQVRYRAANPIASDDAAVPEPVAAPSARATPVLRKSASMPRMRPPGSP